MKRGELHVTRYWALYMNQIFLSVLFLYIYCARIFSELFFSPIFKNWNQKAIEWILRGAGRNEKSKLVLITVKLQSILIFFNIKTQKGLFKKVLLLMFLVHVIIKTNQSLSNLLIFLCAFSHSNIYI